MGIVKLSEALKKAHESQLDLVEIAPDAKPPVVKIIDFKKFKYLEEKKRKEARKKTKETEIKEVRFSPFIGEHDLQTGLKKIEKFILDGDLVKISIIFKGRQMAHTEFGPKLLEKIISRIGNFAEQEREARFEGRRFVTIIRQAKGQKLENKKEDETENQKSSSQEIQDNQNRQNHQTPSDGISSEGSQKQNGQKQI